MRVALAALLGCLFFGQYALANDSGVIQGMVVKGDQELPQVLYIVPWQSTRPTQISEVPVPAWPPVIEKDTEQRRLQLVKKR